MLLRYEEKLLEFTALACVFLAYLRLRLVTLCY